MSLRESVCVCARVCVCIASDSVAGKGVKLSKYGVTLKQSKVLTISPDRWYELSGDSSLS